MLLWLRLDVTWNATIQDPILQDSFETFSIALLQTKFASHYVWSHIFFKHGFWDGVAARRLTQEELFATFIATDLKLKSDQHYPDNEIKLIQIILQHAKWKAAMQ